MAAHSSILALKIPSTEGAWQVTKEADMTEQLSTHIDYAFCTAVYF